MFRISKPTDIGDSEFIALMAMLMSLVALAIDAMLPALGIIGEDLKVSDPNHTQYIIILIFLGMAIGQLIFGPLSDSIGRKPAIHLSIIIFLVGSSLSLIAMDFRLMIIGRILQGLGIAGPRIVTIALIRDRYAGRDMARVMSFVMTLFILVPVIAPALGQIIISFSHWRVIFALFLLLGLISMCWLAIRQPETLPKQSRTSFSLPRIMKAIREVCLNRVALGYSLMSGVISGVFLAFLSTSPQILQVQYELGLMFPFYFAVLAIAGGIGSFLNGKMVMRYGMQHLTNWSLYILFLSSLLYWFPAEAYLGHPPLWSFIIYLFLMSICIGFIFGNLNAMAMQPLGHIAGVGAAVVGSLANLISVPIGAYIGISYNGSVLPLVLGFIVCSLVCIALMIWITRQSGKV